MGLGKVGDAGLKKLAILKVSIGVHVDLFFCIYLRRNARTRKNNQEMFNKHNVVAILMASSPL